MPKEKIEYVTEREQLYFNYCSIDEAIQMLQNAKDRFGSEANVHMSHYESYGDPDGHIEVTFQRPENEAEKSERLKRLKRMEEYERQKYLELKKRFGDS